MTETEHTMTTTAPGFPSVLQWAGDPAIIGKTILKEAEHADWKHLAERPRPVMGPTELGSFAATVNTTLDLFDAQQAFRAERGHAAVAAWFLREWTNAGTRRPWPSLVKVTAQEPVAVTGEMTREAAVEHQTGPHALAAAPVPAPQDNTGSTDEALS